MAKKITLEYAHSLGYDSTEEYYFHQRNPHLIQCTNDFYKYTFHDANGSPFRAKPDFYHPELQCWIEFKCHRLNNKETKQESDYAYNQQAPHKRTPKGLDFLRLEVGWNHSLHKQAKVQSALKAMGKRMIVVFKDGTKMGHSVKKMKQQGLEWFYEEDFRHSFLFP